MLDWGAASARLRIRLDLAIVQASMTVPGQPATEWRPVTSVLDLIRDIGRSDGEGDFDDDYSSGMPNPRAVTAVTWYSCCCWCSAEIVARRIR
jgi:hypothetical protein